MDVLEVIKSRKSIRGYKSTPVPREILREIIDIACRAPSDVNAQPWEITVVTGEVLDNIRRGNVEKLTSGEVPNLEVPSYRYEGKYRQRQVDLAAYGHNPGRCGQEGGVAAKRLPFLRRASRHYSVCG